MGYDERVWKGMSLAEVVADEIYRARRDAFDEGYEQGLKASAEKMERLESQLEQAWWRGYAQAAGFKV